MWKQNNLFGQTLDLNRKSENPLEGICCEACYMAKEEKCTCRCHGAYHGLGNLNHQKKLAKRSTLIDPNYEKVLPENEASEFRKQYDPQRIRCFCGYDLSNEPIIYYVPHSDGWTVKCETEKVWLYVKCPKCGYEKSLWKIGVHRDFSVILVKEA